MFVNVEQLFVLQEFIMSYEFSLHIGISCGSGALHCFTVKLYMQSETYPWSSALTRHTLSDHMDLVHWTVRIMSSSRPEWIMSGRLCI